MTQFFFSLTDGDCTIPDRTGIDLDGTSAVRSMAMHGGQRIIANLNPTVLVTSETGNLVYATKFAVGCGDAEANAFTKQTELMQKIDAAGETGVWKFNVEKLSLELTPGACKLLSLPEGNGDGKYKNVLAKFERTSRSALKRALLNSCDKGGRFELDALVDAENGKPVAVVVRGVGIHVNAQDRYIYGTVNLIESVSLSSQHVWEMANLDPLTGLANRAVFSRHLDEAMQQAATVGN